MSFSSGAWKPCSRSSAAITDSGAGCICAKVVRSASIPGLRGRSMDAIDEKSRTVYRQRVRSSSRVSVGFSLYTPRSR